ncbi:MAG: phosphopyruvate hydratase [Patescibacteria group bacterium]
MSNIQHIYAREILDSRGIPTVECSIWLDTGQSVISSVPSGTSKGKYEAVELRDNDATRMLGKGVLTAVANINTVIAPQLIGKDPSKQNEHDQLLITLDGTNNKSRLGANATLAVSQAILKAGAVANGLNLYQYVHQLYNLSSTLNIPSCVYSVINGGKHGTGNLDIQEFHLIPATNLDFNTSLNMAVTFFQKLDEVLASKGAIRSTGLGGGYAPNLYNNIDAFEILVETAKMTPYTFAQDIFLGVDVAAGEFYKNNKYELKDREEPYSAQEMLEYYLKMKKLYHLMYIEDPFHEDDTDSWQKLTHQISESTSIVGDSLLVTNKNRLIKAAADKLCNSILIKPNQVGTIMETIQVIQQAKTNNWQTIISHRSGETIDDFIADFAVGVGADYVKFGPPNRGERTAKYNRLLSIDLELRNTSS